MSVRPVDGVDRRRILKAAAWSAPVIMVAAAAPAAAASTSLASYISVPSFTFTIDRQRKNGAWAATVNLKAGLPADAIVTWAVTYTSPDGAIWAGPTYGTLTSTSTALSGTLTHSNNNNNKLPKGTYSVTLSVKITAGGRSEDTSFVPAPPSILVK